MKTIRVGNDTYEISKCEKCGGRYIFHSFLVFDGYDDIEWDFDEWCDDCNELGIHFLDTLKFRNYHLRGKNDRRAL